MAQHSAAEGASAGGGPMSASRCEFSFSGGTYRLAVAPACRPEGCRAHEGTIAAVGMPAWFVA